MRETTRARASWIASTWDPDGLNLADELNAVRKELASRPANQTAVQASLQELLDAENRLK